MHAYMNAESGVDNAVVAASSSCDVKDDAGRRVDGERKKDVEYGRGREGKGGNGDALRYIIMLADSFPNKSLTVSPFPCACPTSLRSHDNGIRLTTKQLYDALFARLSSADTKW